MRHRLAALACLAVTAFVAGCSLPSPVPTASRAGPLPGLGPSDTRIAVDLTSAPWRSVGAVVTAQGGHCTGALVGRRTVLTAAHCLVDPRTAEPVEPRAVQFILALSPEAGGRRVGIAGFVIAPGFAVAPGPRPDPRAPPDADWAVLVLDTAAPPERVLPVASGLPLPGVGLALGGYQADRPTLLVADLGCSVLGYGRDAMGRVMLRHSCTATSGSSGGPLLVGTPDGRWVVAGIGSLAASGMAGGWAVPGATIRQTVEELVRQRGGLGG